MSDSGIWGWIWAAVAVAIGVAVGVVGKFLLFALMTRIARRADGKVDDLMIGAARGPALLILPIFAVQFAMTLAPVPSGIADPLHRLLSIGLIIGVCWLAIALLGAIAHWLSERAANSERSPSSLRSFRTRVHLLTRVISGIVIVITAAIALLTVPSVQKLGASILASAGIAGIVAGFAAQSILANLLAGLQLAMTEPIRIGDIVVVEKEQGTIEEINSTFVVVRLDNLRRLIVPLKYFLENRFENWSLHTTELVGAVSVITKQAVAIPDLRGELERFLKSSENWDGKVGTIHAADVTQDGVQLKALVSAATPDKLRQLRIDVREAMLGWLQARSGDALTQA